MSKETVFRKALDNHLDYLKKIQATIHGSGDYCGTDHRTCPLGQWLYGQGAGDV